MPEIKQDLYNFDTALFLAMRIHAGQLDKGGEPYILHPIRVAMRLKHPMQRVLALLHDVLEDASELTQPPLRAEINAYFGSNCLGLVEKLTRGEEKYEDYIAKLAVVDILRQVKLADLEDNLDEQRWERTGYAPPVLQRKRYLWARWYLQTKEIDAMLELRKSFGLCKSPNTQVIEKAQDSASQR